MSVQCRKAGKVMRYFWVVSTALMLILVQSAGSFVAEEIGPENLLTNPSFEEGEDGKVPPTWHKCTLPDKGESTFIRATGGRTKESKGMAVVKKLADDKWVYGCQYVKRAIREGERYRFSVWLRSEYPMTVQLIINVVAYDENGEYTTESSNWAPSNVVPTWRKYSSLVTVEEGKECENGVVKVSIDIYTNQPYDIAVEIDDAELVCLPEAGDI